MKIGCCVPLFDDRILLLPSLGIDYAEIGLASLEECGTARLVRRMDELRAAGVECLSANLMFPSRMRLTGENADHAAAASYLENVLPKAEMLGIRKVVFGSSGPRSVPDGFPRERAWAQLVALCRDVIEPAFARRGMVCCIEPLRRAECNIINTCAEGAELVREVGCGHVRLLVDLYHMDSEGEPREVLSGMGDILAHTHIASAKNSRAIPHSGDGEDYGEFFRALALSSLGEDTWQGKR